MLLGPWEFWCRDGKVGNVFPLLSPVRSRHIPPTPTFSSCAGEVLGTDNPQSGVSLHPRVWGKMIRTLRLYLATKGDSSSYKQTVICLYVVTAWCRYFVLVLVLVLCPVGCGLYSLDKVLDSPLYQLLGASPGSTCPHPWVLWQLRKLAVFLNFPFWLVTLSITVVPTLPFPSSAPRSGLLLFCHSP